MLKLSETLEIATHCTPDGQTVIRLAGPLDAVGETRLMDEVVRADPHAGDVVVLNLEDVTFIDSAGIGAIIYVEAFVRVRGGEFVIPSSSLRAAPALKLAGLTATCPRITGSSTGFN